MRRHSSKMVILGALMVILSLAMMFQPLFTWALELNDLRGCAFEVDPKEHLFQLGNMNPGDTYQGTVTITKTGPSPGDIYFSFTHIDSDPLYPDDVFNLFEQLVLIIKQGDQVLYEGPMVGGASPGDPLLFEDFKYLVSMVQGDIVLLDFFIILPGPTTGNEYQGAYLETELIFVSVCQDTPRPGINIEKATNGEDADLPTGPSIPVGGTVTWTYVVTNTGNVPLSNIVVTDNQGVTPVYVSGDTNGDNLLDVDETWIFEATGTAVPGQYANIGTVVGTPPTGSNVTDSDPSHYIGFYPDEPSINIEKATNGVDADTPTGPAIPVGGAVTWTYEVTNPGNVPLSNIIVTDNQGVIPVYVSGDTNNDGLLDIDETWIFEATGTAVPGQYANIGTVIGTPPTGPNVTDSDPSHYFGVPVDMPVINIEKATNGVDADNPTGPFIPVGDNVTWTYVVTNPGNVPLSNIIVTDNRPGVVPVYVSGDINNDGILQVGETWVYEATGIAVSGQYSNIGSVTGTPPEGPNVNDSDPSHYFGVVIVPPSINIEKYTNGVDADTPTGPSIPIGGAVTWTYVVTNTGNVPLSNVTVTDNQGVIPVYVGGDTNNDGLLDVDETWIFEATGIAAAGQYANIGTVVGTPPTGPDVSDSDPSHYIGFTPDEPTINIEKHTNGFDADIPTGPSIPVGGVVTWTYYVTNPGIVPLSNIVVTDNRMGVNPVYISGDTNADGILQPGEIWIYEATGVASAGQYSNIGTVVGTPPTGPNVTDNDPSHYFGLVPDMPDIKIEKATNGVDADLPTGPGVPIGSTVTWTYEITNPGNVPLSNITVTDNQGVIPVYVSGDTNNDGLLDIGETWIFEATGTAVPGQYANIGTVVGTPPLGPNVTDSDPSHYFGILLDVPAINIEKATNGVDADTPTGPFIPVGNNVTWTYEVTNPGNVPLSNIVVTDNRAGVNPVYISGDTNADGVLQPGEIWIYQATGVAVAGQYSNIGTVVGTPPTGTNVTDSDPSHYFGISQEVPAINIEKLTNGVDADTPTGPFISVGDTVTWTYVVTNPGNVPLRNIVVTDNRTGVNPVYISGDINGNGLLDVGETWIYQATGIATAGQYSNIGTVVGTPPTGPNVTDSDPSHYFGVIPPPSEDEVEPEDPDVDPEKPIIIVPPEGPKVDPPLPRTDGFSIMLFVIGLTMIFAGLFLKKSFGKDTAIE